ncbi:RNA-directed DNA polymerase [Micromonospora sp. NPDC047527]|uniref:RNA-directed DNA polymerase n=1 Tax=Micromonospora sp. NPDC047527 TaxID=3155144 RepID=UPI0033CDBD79
MHLGLNLAAGCKVAIDEMYGDWYRDPWGWPEFQWFGKNLAKVDISPFIRKDKGEGYVLSNPAAFHLMEVPKNRLAVRPAVVQDSISRLLYATAVASNGQRLHGDLADWAFGWRTRGGDSFVKNRDEWRNYIDSFADKEVRGLAGLHVDIASCFASVNVDRLSEIVYGKLGKTAAAGLISDIIRRHDSLITRSGIPQRSFSSAALAHLYFQPIDDALRLASQTGLHVVRWMDDITAIGSEEALYGLYLNLQDKAAQLGLTLNAAKSRLVDADHVVGFVRDEDLKEIQTDKVVEGGYDGLAVVSDSTHLLELQDECLEDPGVVPRTKLRALLTSLVRCHKFERWEDWMNVAHRIPHAADALGRYLEKGSEHLALPGLVESPRWEPLQEFVVDFAHREFGKVNWVIAQLALSVPAGKMGPRMTDMMRDWLAESDDVQKVAISAQRLAAERPVDCRDIIRNKIDRTSDPVLLRILALGLVAAKDERRLIRSVLERDVRNSLVLSMLDDTNWKAPDVAKDFDLESSD